MSALTLHEGAVENIEGNRNVKLFCTCRLDGRPRGGMGIGFTSARKMPARICLALTAWLFVVAQCPDTTGRVTNSPAGWVSTRTDKTGINDASVADKTGTQFAYVDDYPNTGLFDGALTTTSEILSSNLTAWVHYTLTCDVTVSGSGGVGAIDLLAGTNVIASVTNAPATANDFSVSHALETMSSLAKISIIPTDSHPYLGQTLAIRLRKVAGVWNADVLFDNLRLDAVDTSSDTNSPVPTTMLWHSGPVASANTSITMTATTATDDNHVQYFFTNTVNGNVSGWISSPVWTDTGLTDGVTYSYKVKARDNSSNYNETAWSDEAGATASSSVLLYESFEAPVHADVTSAYATNSQGWVYSTTLSGNAGLHDEASGKFVTPYGSQAAYVYDNVGTMDTKYTIANMGAVLEAGTQYVLSFNVAAENNGPAGYGVELLAGTNVVATVSGTSGTNNMAATSRTITFTPAPGHPHLGQTIGVRLRKPTGAWNAGHIIYDNIQLAASDTSSDVSAPTPNPSTWLAEPVPVSGSSIYMIAATASDPNGIQYFFTNTVNGHVSGWQSSPGWTDTGLTDGATYTYKVKTRDCSSNLNESDWSAVKSTTVNSDILLYESFEAPPHADVTNEISTNSQGWVLSTTGTGKAGLHDEASGKFVTPYGSQAAYLYDNVGTLNTRYTITNTAAVLEVGTQYVLSFNAAAENNGPAGYGVDLLAGTNVIATASGTPGTNNMAATSRTITFSPAPDNPYLGQTIGVRLRKPTGGYSTGHILYDNVLLVASRITFSFYESFENPDTTGRVTNSPSGWISTRTDKTGINDSSMTGKTGSQFAYLDDYPNTGLRDGALATTPAILHKSLTAWVHYTLTCDIAVGGSGAAGAIDLLAGTNVIASVTNAPASANSFSATAALSSLSSQARISFIATDSNSHLGQPLAIRLRQVAGAWNQDVMFDNLRLEASDTSFDTTAPVPNAMLWDGGPVASANAGITMTAARASDANHVQYFFTNTVNGHVSGWIDANIWTDTGLTDGVAYAYKVKARDNSKNDNETGWSEEASATADSEVLLYESFEAPPHADVTASYATNSQGWVRTGTGTAGLHDEAAGTFATPFGSQAAYVYDNVGSMGTKYTIANTGAVLEAGIKYILSFNAAAENGGNAGYGVDLLAGTNVIATASGSPGTNGMAATSRTITFSPAPGNPRLGQAIGVRLRKPTGGYSGGHIIYDNVLLLASSTAADVTAPSPDPSTWRDGSEPAAAANNSITMTASQATDVNGVQYYFSNTVNGNSSGWQDSPAWTDANLTPYVTYSYKVKTRDISANLNETDWSSEESAVVDPYLVFHDSFETPIVSGRTPDGGTMPPGWSRSDNRAGLWNEDSGTMSTPYGYQAAWIWNARYITTTSIVDTLKPNYTYTLTFNAAAENASGSLQYKAELLAGTSVVASTVGETIASGNMSVSGGLVFATGQAHANLGQTLAVRFRYNSGDWYFVLGVDNVVLRAVPIGHSTGSVASGVTYDYLMSPFEVTASQYVACLNALTNGELSVEAGEVYLAATTNLLCLTTNAAPAASVTYDAGAVPGARFSVVAGRGDHPMMYVTWFGAATFCNWKSAVEGLDAAYSPANGWASVTTNSGYRLPTQAEWVKAAAWSDMRQRFYAFGTSSDTMSTNAANYLNSSDIYEANAVSTAPVGSYSGRSPYGLADASGNIAEWSNDLLSGSEPDVDPHKVHGGSWGSLMRGLLVTGCSGLKPEMAESSVGFRTARTLVWE